MRRLGSRDRGERGEATTQLVLVTPAIIVLLLAVVQTALWLHAAQVGTAAASRGVHAAASHGATAADGVAAASSFVTDAGGALTNLPVVVRGDSFVEARVTVHLARLLPLAPRDVTRVVRAPVERFVAEPDR